MDELNSFQKNCEQELIKALNNPLQQKSIDGIKGKYITGLLPNMNLRVYIYDDGAEIVGENVDFRFESPDYSNLTSLINAFVSKAVELYRAKI